MPLPETDWIVTFYVGMVAISAVWAFKSVHPTRAAHWIVLALIGLFWPLFVLWVVIDVALGKRNG